MYLIRKAIDRGHADHGWLQANHSFSFGNYVHPDHMSFRSLRVLNEDHIAPGAGFPAHGHRDMEIITYPLAGRVAHRDSTGASGVIRRGEIQYMSAGRGVSHSEFNGSASDPLHLLQIWIVPDKEGYDPRYEQRDYADSIGDDLHLIASQHGRDGSIAIRQDVDLYASRPAEGVTVSHAFNPERYGYLQVARGGLRLGDTILQPGDGVKISDERDIRVTALSGDAELLLFDLA